MWLGWGVGVSLIAMSAGLLRSQENRLGWALWWLGALVALVNRWGWWN